MKDKICNKDLIGIAKKSRRNAVAEFSDFKVGAAILTDDGRIFTGCNIENPSLMLTICAERVAILKALSEGARGFKKIAVFAAKNPCYPCGSCRQFLFEFAQGIEVVTIDSAGKIKSIKIEKFLPKAFKYKK